MSYSRPMQLSGASRLFASRNRYVIPTADSNDESAGSSAEEEDEGDELLVSPGFTSRRKTRSRRLFTSCAEKGSERKRGKERVMGMSVGCSGSFQVQVHVTMEWR